MDKRKRSLLPVAKSAPLAGVSGRQVLWVETFYGGWAGAALHIGGNTRGDRFSPQAGMPKLSGRVTGRPSRISCNLSSCASVRSNARSRLAS